MKGRLKYRQVSYEYVKEPLVYRLDTHRAIGIWFLARVRIVLFAFTSTQFLYPIRFSRRHWLEADEGKNV